MSGSWLKSIALAFLPAGLLLALLVSEQKIDSAVAILLAMAVLLGAGIAVRRRIKAEDVVMRRLNRLTAEAQTQLDALSYKAAVADRIVNSLPHPIFFLDSDRRVVRMNAVAGALIDSDITGRDLGDGLRDPGLMGAIDRVLKGEGPQSVDLNIPVPVETDYIARIEPVEPPPGTPKGRDAPVVLVDLQDVTALRRSEKMRVDFVANVSHELRTPLTSLTGFIETLRGPAKDDAEAREKFLDIMQEQSERMYRLISDLLSLSKIELDEHSRPKEPVNLPEILERLVAMLEPRAVASGVRIELMVPEDLPPVRGDADQLFQVFQNLLENAMKYGEQGGVVKIRCSVRDGRRVVTEIEDFGPGIPAEHIPRLTERFYRVDTARSRQLGGTGLGLAIVKHILNRHRARLTITSELGKGSVFGVALPVLQNSRMIPDGSTDAEESVRRRRAG
ncbi:MAG: ATP-binding protein [Alphaproteobacteria bacterium]